MSHQNIRAIALCIFHSEGRILVNESFDPVKKRRFCRPLGGGIEFGETSKAAIVREIREELGAEVINARILGTLENIFSYAGKPHHEMVQIYDAEFADPAMHTRPWLPGTESDGTRFQAIWREMSYFTSDAQLVPQGLSELLESYGIV